ncbi:MAG: hypothetical protein KGD58_09120 [Candidatus Lokiarchaeota archaeon]|nr:hypothetical protein [Candidatus Lokiarchaeota archaeon]
MKKGAVSLHSCAAAVSADKMFSKCRKIKRYERNIPPAPKMIETNPHNLPFSDLIFVSSVIFVINFLIKI